jgi:adenylate kinase
MRCNVDGTSLVHRDDDTEETARRRSEVFYQRTYPILEFYQRRGISIEIDGQGSIAQVRERVRNALAGTTGVVA